MESSNFKSTLFGGFDREDVIQYITRASADSTARIESLEADVDRLCAQERELSTQLAALRGEKDALSADLLAASGERDSLRTSLDGANAELAELRAALDSLRAENTALRTEKDALRAEAEKLRPLAEQYTAVKTHIAGIELDAHQRAEAYEHGVRERLNAAIDECRAHCDSVLSSLSTTCIKVTEDLRRTETSVSSLPSAFSALRESLDRLDESK